MSFEEYVEKKVKDIQKWISEAALEGRDVSRAAARVKHLKDLLDEYHNQEQIDYDDHNDEEILED